MNGILQRYKRPANAPRGGMPTQFKRFVRVGPALNLDPTPDPRQRRAVLASADEPDRTGWADCGNGIMRKAYLE